MKKLLVLAALSAMALGAKAEYWTVNISGAKAVYFMEQTQRTEDKIKGSDYYRTEKWLEPEDGYKAVLLNKEKTRSETWADHYNYIEQTYTSINYKFEEVSDGNFQIAVKSKTGDDYVSDEALIVAIMDSDKFAAGSSFVAYYGIAPMTGGAFELESLGSGSLGSDSPTPAPEPTSGLLLLLGVAGLALKRKRA